MSAVHIHLLLPFGLLVAGVLGAGACDDSGQTSDTSLDDTVLGDTVGGDGLDTASAAPDGEDTEETPYSCVLPEPNRQRFAAGGIDFVATDVDAFPGTLVARRVGADVVVQISWHGEDAGAPQHEQSRAFRVALRLVNVADGADWSGSIDGDEIVPLSAASWFAGTIPRDVQGPEAVAHGCATASWGSDDLGDELFVSVAVEATLPGAAASETVTISVAGHTRSPVEKLATKHDYAGQCDDEVSPPVLHPVGAYWFASQLPGAWAYGWDAVEADCHLTGCYHPSIYACGGGDRWRCGTCYEDVCVQPAFVSECLPDR